MTTTSDTLNATAPLAATDGRSTSRSVDAPRASGVPTSTAVGRAPTRWRRERRLTAGRGGT